MQSLSTLRRRLSQCYLPKYKAPTFYAPPWTKSGGNLLGELRFSIRPNTKTVKR